MKSEEDLLKIISEADKVENRMCKRLDKKADGMPTM